MEAKLSDPRYPESTTYHEAGHKDVQELRQTYLNRKAGKPVGHDETVRFDVFKERLHADADTYNAQAYYVILGTCPR